MKLSLGFTHNVILGKFLFGVMPLYFCLLFDEVHDSILLKTMNYYYYEYFIGFAGALPVQWAGS